MINALNTVATSIKFTVLAFSKSLKMKLRHKRHCMAEMSEGPEIGACLVWLHL